MASLKSVSSTSSFPGGGGELGRDSDGRRRLRDTYESITVRVVVCMVCSGHVHMLAVVEALP